MPTQPLLAGRRIRLKEFILGVDVEKPKGEGIVVKKGEIVQVLRQPSIHDPRMVDVQWDDTTLMMFAADLVARGEDVAK